MVLLVDQTVPSCVLKACDFIIFTLENAALSHTTAPSGVCPWKIHLITTSLKLLRPCGMPAVMTATLLI
jgi:hypothetical protein